MNKKIILTESEKNSILGMHKKAMIKENVKVLNEADLKQIQQLLIQKGIMSPTLASGKASDDGRLGPVTLNAIYSALTQSQGTPAQGTPAQGNPAQAQPQTLDLVPGLIGLGYLQDEMEGRTMVVNKVTPLSCGITEVEFKNAGGQQLVYGYYKPSDLNDVAIKNRDISFRRLGDGVKATDACKQYDTNEFGRAGSLKFGTKPNEKPVIE